MELRHLRYFVAVGEEENYRRAAQRLHVAQTALSTQIQDLEAELGFKLFDRLPRGVKLSVAGRLFLEDARAAIAGSPGLEQNMNDGPPALVMLDLKRVGAEVRSSGCPYVERGSPRACLSDVRGA